MTLVIDARDAPASNVTGNSISITLFTTLKWWGGPYMKRLLLPLPRYARKAMLGDMDGLSFISFASWTVIRDLPDNGPDQPVKKLKKPHLFFEVIFNGGWAQYVDSSLRVLSFGMKLFWGSSRTYPGLLPAADFMQFFRDHELPCAHLYCAYPDATVTMVRQAVELEPKLDALVAKAGDLNDEQFDAAYTRFLGEVQGLL